MYMQKILVFFQELIMYTIPPTEVLVSTVTGSLLPSEFTAVSMMKYSLSSSTGVSVLLTSV